MHAFISFTSSISIVCGSSMIDYFSGDMAYLSSLITPPPACDRRPRRTNQGTAVLYWRPVDRARHYPAPNKQQSNTNVPGGCKKGPSSNSINAAGTHRTHTRWSNCKKINFHICKSCIQPLEKSYICNKFGNSSTKVDATCNSYWVTWYQAYN